MVLGWGDGGPSVSGPCRPQAPRHPTQVPPSFSGDPDCSGCLSRAGSAFARQAAPRSGPSSQTSSNKAGSSIRRHPTLYRPRATRLMPRAARSRRGKPHPGPRATPASAAGEYVHSRIAPPTPVRVAPLKSPRHGAVSPLFKFNLTECVLSDIVENAVSFYYQRNSNWRQRRSSRTCRSSPMSYSKS